MSLGGTCSVPQCMFNYAVCVFISIGYVGSLYIWKTDKYEDRCSPTVLKKRFVSVIGVTLISPGLVKQFMEGYLLHEHSLWHVLGFRTPGLLAALTIPLILTSFLFLGPILSNDLTSDWSLVAHIFCNFMGFPDVSALSQIPPPLRTIVKLSYLVGVIGWAYLLPYLTAPTIYHNDLPWVSRL